MLHNYYTLRFITADLDRTLKGAPIQSLFSQNKNELVISFQGGPALIASCEPGANFLSLRSSFARAKRNSIDIFPFLHGAVVQAISIQPADREIGVKVSGNRHLLIQLYGSRANVLLVDDDRRISDAFLHPALIKGTTAPIARQTSPHPDSFESFDGRLRTIGHLSLVSVLKKMYPLFGSLVIREMLFRSGIIEETATVAEISPVLSRKLFDAACQLEEELTQRASPRIYSRDSSAVAFSLLELFHLQDLSVQQFDSVHTAIRTFLGSTFGRKSLLAEKEPVIKGLRKEKDRVERTLAKMAEESADIDRAGLYERYGRILLAHATELTKGMKSARLPNLFSPAKETIEIPLDPHLAPARNAERYFDKAKKTRHARREQADRKQNYHDRYDLLRRLLDGADPIQTREQWNDFVQTHREELVTLGVVQPQKAEKGEQVPFRTFVVDGGFQVWAGKNSQNNDLLTMKHSRPKDLWFHARGGGGSHVILRSGTGKGEISKKALHQAASIAAFYSKLKNSRLVPVAMTERKHVRKPRGAPAGTVTIEREKVLMVEPRLPVKEKE